jgi:hypothetical protein
MSTPRRVRVGALVIATAALALAGCGGSSSKSVSSSPTTGSAQSGSSAQFVPQAHGLVVAFESATKQFEQQGQAAGTNVGAISTAATTLQGAATRLADGLATLTPPPAKATATHDYIALIRDFAANIGKLGSAAAANDKSGLSAADVAIKADGAKINALNAQFGN